MIRSGDAHLFRDPPVKTIGVHLWADQARGGKQNHATMMRPAVVPTLDPRGLHELFVGAYAKFADRCREAEERLVQVMADGGWLK